MQSRKQDQINRFAKEKKKESIIARNVKPITLQAKKNMLIEKRKSLNEIIEFRKKILFEADTNSALQKELTEKCNEDILFFINGFLWTYNPRKPPYHFPFYLYPKQAEFAKEIFNLIKNNKGSLAEKSRDWGLTYLYLAIFLNRFLLGSSFEALLISLRQEEVDNPTPSSLFGKIRYMARRLPYWLMPLKWDWSKHGDIFKKFINPDNWNSIVGQSTTEDAGRSGRKSAILIDEHSAIRQRIIDGIERAVRHTSLSVNRISTPRGINTFKKLRDKKICKILTAHWTQIPDKCEGLYYKNGNGNKIACENLPYKRRSPYGYYIDNKGNTTKYMLRSKWFDKEDREKLSERDLFQELQIRYFGSGYCRFDANMLEEKSAHVEGGIKGRLELRKGLNDIQEVKSKEDILFIETKPEEYFEIELWQMPKKPIFNNRSFIGVDTAEGLEHGDYDSADVLIKNMRGDKFYHAAALHGHWKPDKFADKLAMLGYFYDNGALIVLERNKDGYGIGLRLQNEIEYSNLYYDDKDYTVGYRTTAVRKSLYTQDIDRAFREDELDSKSIGHFSEMSTFENSNGKLGASGGNNDDRVISLSLAYYGAKNTGRPELAAQKQQNRIKNLLRTKTNKY